MSLIHEKLLSALLGLISHCSEWVEKSPCFLCACKEWITFFLDEFRMAMISLSSRIKNQLDITCKISKIFSAVYFWCEVAPFCCSLSGCRQSKAFWYVLFTAFPSIISTRGTGFHPLPDQRTCDVSAANISLRGRQFQVSRSQKIWFRSSTKLSKP